MKRQLVRYAIIRFRPHTETEEFANVGIVLVAPTIGYFDFRLESKRFGRLNSFFDDVGTELVRTVLTSFDAELARIRDLAAHKGNGQTRFEFDAMDNADFLFDTLTKDREGIIYFSNPRFALTDRPQEKLEELFEHYVKRSFSNSTYREGLLEKHVRNIFKMRDIAPRFKRRRFYDGLYSATFPFVEMEDDKPTRVLKPIYLGQDDPTRILDHGNKWLFSYNRLKSLLPKNFVFAVEGPEEPSLRQLAFQETIALFKDNDIQVVDAKNERELLNAVMH